MLNGHVLPVSCACFSKWSSCWPSPAPECWSDGTSNLCSESHLTRERGPPLASLPSVLCYFYQLFYSSFFATRFSKLSSNTPCRGGQQRTRTVLLWSQSTTQQRRVPAVMLWVNCSFSRAANCVFTTNCESSEATGQCWLNDITENLWAGLFDSHSSAGPELQSVVAALLLFILVLYSLTQLKVTYSRTISPPLLWNDGHIPSV